MAVGAAASLVLATFVASALASLAEKGSLPPDKTFSSTNHKPPDHLVLHGLRFGLTTGQLDEGSKAVLDYAAELLKEDPEMIVTVVQNPDDGSSSTCGLSEAQGQIIAAYIRSHGVPAPRLRLCSATPTGQINHASQVVSYLAKSAAQAPT
jgi:hypothetical protein